MGCAFPRVAVSLGLSPPLGMSLPCPTQTIDRAQLGLTIDSASEFWITLDDFAEAFDLLDLCQFDVIIEMSQYQISADCRVCPSGPPSSTSSCPHSAPPGRFAILLHMSHRLMLFHRDHQRAVA